MEALREESSQRIVAITVGDSTVFMPSGFNPEKELGSFVWDRLPTGVAISSIRLSVTTLLMLIEETYQRLMKTDQAELARQILPRGGHN